jgi:hypothetical protein
LFASAFVAQLAAAWFRWVLNEIAGRPLGAISAPMPRITGFFSTIGHNMPLSREICKMCFWVNPVGFYVPDEIWLEAIPPEHRSSVVCISCFARLADEKLIPWDGQIQLYPVSMATHWDNVKTGEKKSEKNCEATEKKGAGVGEQFGGDPARGRDTLDTALYCRTQEEAAAYLGVATKTVHRYKNERSMPMSIKAMLDLWHKNEKGDGGVADPQG